MLPDGSRAASALFVALALMLGEFLLSRRHEAALLSRGAIEPPGDVYRALAWVYPLTFVFMAAEGLLTHPDSPSAAMAGLVVFTAAKVLKWWAVWWLGPRWTFRVLVLPGSPLVTGGPYAWLRHPNYLAVFGEIAGFALFVGATVSGVASMGAFAVLVRRRIAVEERALGRPG